MQEVVKARTTVKVINEAREELCAQTRTCRRRRSTGSRRSHHSKKDVVEMCVKVDDSLSFEERVSMLNADQRRVFDGVRLLEPPEIA